MSRSIESMLGLLKIRVKRGIDLVVSDAFSSDPYVVITQGKQVCCFINNTSYTNSIDILD